MLGWAAAHWEVIPNISRYLRHDQFSTALVVPHQMSVLTLLYLCVSTCANPQSAVPMLCRSSECCADLCLSLCLSSECCAYSMPICVYLRSASQRCQSVCVFRVRCGPVPICVYRCVYRCVYLCVHLFLDAWQMPTVNLNGNKHVSTSVDVGRRVSTSVNVCQRVSTSVNVC